ncbi:MAG: hypothetical protein MRY83_06080, partial [Flavobacteriales bacterium]|nr:hypothetical protein [Flavobacteriales bacterium]
VVYQQVIPKGVRPLRSFGRMDEKGSNFVQKMRPRKKSLIFMSDFFDLKSVLIYLPKRTKSKCRVKGDFPFGICCS